MSDKKQIGQWLEAQQQQIKRWAFRMSRKLTNEDVDGILQQVSVEMLNRDDGIEKPFALAKTITAYRVFDALRQRNQAAESLHVYTSDGREVTRPELSAPTGAEQGKAKERCGVLLDAMRGLADIDRRVLTARWFEECTFTEIARREKISESSARNYFNDAVNSLHRILKHVRLSGIVTNDVFEALPEAKISVRGVRISEFRRLETDKYGQFAFMFLESGEYSIKVAKAGYIPDQRRIMLDKHTDLPPISLNKESCIAEIRERA